MASVAWSSSGTGSRWQRSLGEGGHRVATEVPSNWHSGAGDCKHCLPLSEQPDLLGLDSKRQGGARGGERQGSELDQWQAMWATNWPQGSQRQQWGPRIHALGCPPTLAPAFPRSPSWWLQQGLCPAPGRTLTNTLLQLKVTGVPNMSSSHVENLKGVSLLVRAESDVHR